MPRMGFTAEMRMARNPSPSNWWGAKQVHSFGFESRMVGLQRVQVFGSLASKGGLPNMLPAAGHVPLLCAIVLSLSLLLFVLLVFYDH